MVDLRGMTALAATFLLAAAAAAGPSGALGTWSSGGARIDLTEEAGKVVGRLGAEGGPCPLPAGTEVLRGTLLDDSLSAQVRLCLVSPQCGADPGTALAVLLVTKQLTGGVHAKAPCALDAKALVLRRPGASMAMTPPPTAVRLSRTAAPRHPRANAAAPGGHQSIAAAGTVPVSVPASVLTSNAAATQVPDGQIAGRPVGGPRQPGYDPRAARRAGIPPGGADAKLQLGAAYLGRGQFERARKAFRDVLARDPQRAEAYNGVGITFHARGDYDEALAWYKRALEADPRFGDAFYNIACLYALRGNRELALRYLRLAALNRYSGREQLEKDPDLASLRGDPGLAEILEQMDSEAKPSVAGRP
jgi:hypothetical protein